MNESVYSQYEKRFWSEFPFMRNWDHEKGTHEDTAVLCEVSDGWLPLIYDLCSEIKEYMLKNNLDLNSLHMAQIKEKYAELRVYCDGGDSNIYEIISKYEEKSNSICEVCGRAGRLRNVNGWMVTICEKCETKP